MRFDNKNILTSSVLHELKAKIKGICKGLLSCHDKFYSIFSNKHYYWTVFSSKFVFVAYDWFVYHH